MEIELEPVKANFSRCWVTDGVDDFLDAARRFFAEHQGKGHHLSVDDSNDNGKDTDGIRRVWLYCRCGHKRLILGPSDGDDEMTPPIPLARDPRLH